jgi:hypothetical protein
MDVNVYGQKPPRRCSTIASVKSDTVELGNGCVGAHINTDGTLYFKLLDDSTLKSIAVFAGDRFRYPFKQIGASTDCTGVVFFE